MIYVFRSSASQSAKDLADAVDGLRYKTREKLLHRVRRGDKIICWGERLVPIDGVRILNGGPLANKMEDAVKLRQENVPTIEVVRTAPPRVDRVTPIKNRAMNEARFLVDAIDGRGEDHAALKAQFDRTYNEYLAALRDPGPQHEWVPRLFHHIGGNDLFTPPPQPDFFVKKENFVSEYRVHSFMGKSIRAGVKRPLEGAQPHPWIRSFDGNWRIIYDGETVRQRHRDIAHAAVRALGLDFGAVDLGEKANGDLVVFEVNRAPGTSEGTAEVYARAIREWADRRNIA